MNRTLHLIATVTLGLAALPSPTLAKTCELTIEGTDAMQYNKKELKIDAACKTVKLTLKHTGKLPKAAMGHNWVLTETKDMAAMVSAGIKAGPKADYVPKDAKILVSTKVIGGGETTSVTFTTDKLKKGGDYSFFCSFPGHSGLMKGKLTYK